MPAAFLFWNSVPTSGKDGEVFVEGLGQPSNKSCIFRNNEANLMTFYEDQQITEDVVEFPPGTELVRKVYNILELWVLLLHRRCIRYMSLHFSLLCWTLSWSSFFFKTWPAVYLLPSWLQMCRSFLTARLRFLGATILASSLSPDRFDADAVVAIGRAWNQLVSVSVKKTITPVRDIDSLSQNAQSIIVSWHFSWNFFFFKTVEKPPTILFRHQLGPIAQSNDGRLIVYPGTIVHMECLWIRRFGTPKWEVSHQYRYFFVFYFKLKCGWF